MPQNFVLFYACRLGNSLHQHAFPLAVPFAAGIQGQHIRLRIIGIPVVHIPVHMNRHIGNHQKVLLHIDEPGLQSVLSPYNNPPCHGQTSVQPCGKDHAAVFLRVELYVSALHCHLRRLLELKGGRIAVSRSNMKSLRVSFRQSEGNQ